MSVKRSELFKRQTTLSEIGEEGQHKLQQAKVLVVGCGGLGSPIAVYLATSGVGRLHLIDFDKVATSNLHRQVYYDLEDVERFKSETLTRFIKKRAPFTEVTFSTEPVTKSTVLDAIEDFDIIVDGTDSLPTKYLLNDACVLKDKPLIYGSLYKFDGYVSTFNALQQDGSRSANLRDAFPEMKTDVPNCEEAGTLNAIVGIIALAQVNEVIKLITGVGKTLTNELLIYNALENTQLKMQLKPKVTRTETQDIFIKEGYFDPACEIQNPEWLISSDELKLMLSSHAQSSDLFIVSVLPNLDLPFKVNKTIPIGEFNPNQFEIDNDKTYVMVCQKGLNSYKATQQLREVFPRAKVLSLSGGISDY